MKKKISQLSKVTKNAGYGILFKSLTIFLAFANRTLFIRILGEEYLGINGLYTNILSVLSLADLGVNSVLLFFLYEPLVQQNHTAIASLLVYFKKIYYLIAGAVLFLGAILIPFLPYIINGNTLVYHDLVGYYILFVLNTSCSYLAVYKSTLLLADQYAYIVNKIQFATTICQNIIQIGILYVTNNYYAYLVVMICCTLFNNLILTYKTNKRYPFIKVVIPEKNTKEIQEKVLINIKAVFLYRVGGTVMNSTDNILISILVSTVAVGYYSNYVLITSNLLILLNFLSQAIMAGIGNYNVNATDQQKSIVFRSVVLIYYGIAVFVCSCLICTMNDFITIWIRDSEYILSQSFVVLLAIKIFIDIILSPNWMFREASGLFKEVKNIMIWAAVLNLVLSLILGKFFGLSGIIIATSIAKLCTLFWYEPRTFYRIVFHQSLSTYWKNQVFLIIGSIFIIVISVFFSTFLDHSLVDMFFKIIICAFVCFIIMFALNGRTQEGQYLIRKWNAVVKNILKR